MEQGAKQRVFYLDVGCEEGELQRPSELHARGDHAGEHELGPGGAGAPRLARPVGVPVRVLGRPLPCAGAAVEADELHLGVAEVAVGHADGRGPAAPGAGVHGGRQICGRSGGRRRGSGRRSRQSKARLLRSEMAKAARGREGGVRNCQERVSWEARGKQAQARRRLARLTARLAPHHLPY